MRLACMTLVVALAVAWWLDHRGPGENSGRAGSLGPPTDVEVIREWARNTGKDAALVLSDFQTGLVQISKDKIAAYAETSAGSQVEHAHYRCLIESEQTNLNETLFIDRTYPPR
jgi:hypothetical protein